MRPTGAFPRPACAACADEFSRRLMREHVLTANDLIYPVFVLDGTDRSEAVPSMPGVERVSIDRLLGVAEEAMRLAPALGAVPGDRPRRQDPGAEEAWNPRALVPRTVQALKANFPTWA